MTFTSLEISQRFFGGVRPCRRSDAERDDDEGAAELTQKVTENHPAMVTHHVAFVTPSSRSASIGNTRGRHQGGLPIAHERAPTSNSRRKDSGTHRPSDVAITPLPKVADSLLHGNKVRLTPNGQPEGAISHDVAYGSQPAF